jgi:hypothetical protein
MPCYKDCNICSEQEREECSLEDLKYNLPVVNTIPEVLIADGEDSFTFAL